MIPDAEFQLKNKAAIELFKTQEAYQLLIVPLQKEIDKLKNAYECKTLQEIATLKGKFEGLSFVIDLIHKHEEEGTRAQERLQKIEERKKLESQEIDSTDL